MKAGVKQQASKNKKCRESSACHLLSRWLSLFFDPEDGGNMFL
jgi:hypothetical protein